MVTVFEKMITALTKIKHTIVHKDCSNADTTRKR